MGKPAMVRSQSNWFQLSEARGRGCAGLKWCRELQVLSAALYAWPVRIRVPKPCLPFHTPFSQNVQKTTTLPEKGDQEKQHQGFSFACVYLPFIFWSVCEFVVCVYAPLGVRVFACAWIQEVRIGVSATVLHLCF